MKSMIKELAVFAVVLMIISGCSHEKMTMQPQEQSMEESSENLEDMIFEGRVTEVYDAGAVVEVEDGFPIRNSGTEVSIRLGEEEAPVKAGDRVRVTYRGGVLESFPLQLENQLSIQILEEEQEEWELLISKAILSENQGKYTGEECVAEGHRILDMERKESEVKIYALTMYGEYQFQDGNFVKEAGSGVIPAVFVFQEDKDGKYTLSSCEIPEDGSGYTESIQRMFPQSLQETCISPAEEICAELKHQETQYASEYLKKLGRTAAIGEYRDFSHPLLTERGVSIEVSNRLMENKDIGGYPYWIGNIEKLENGMRYVYQTDLDLEQKKIILTKTEYDSGNVKEIYEFNSETGEEER